jgi:phospho-N-acetylmuramoyl-pentapeptide-transferase
MFYWLTELPSIFGTPIPGLNVFRYITTRTGGAMMTAALFVFLFGPWIIDHLRLRQGKGQPIREDGPKSHIVAKRGTPTMGGLMILSGLVVATLLWANLRNPYVWIVLAVTLGFGFVGFYDDYLKVTKQTHAGFSGKTRLLIEAIIAGCACLAIIWIGRAPLSTSLAVPFFKDILLNFGWFFMAFTTFIIVGAGNAVNLTDGLDGLAISTFAVSAATYTALAYVTGHAVFANYLLLPHFAPIGELTIFCGALVGASLGFLWWNAHPADIFMGDVGSLGLGGALGTVALLIKQELLLPIVCGVFVLEGLSVILQVASFKLRGKRIFRMAPLHHHFELSGWAEPKVITRFLILAIIFALFSLTTLKLR